MFNLFIASVEEMKRCDNNDICENDINEKRANYLKWDEYFMFSAKLASKRSKDPSRQVGCVIVNNMNRIIGSGYNFAMEFQTICCPGQKHLKMHLKINIYTYAMQN